MTRSESVSRYFSNGSRIESLRIRILPFNLFLETLRKHSAAGAVPRVCNKEYRIPGTEIVLEAGTRITIPIHGIHRDPEYYPEPEKFDPERFSEECKSQRPSFSFLAFGEGPRICIGEKKFDLIEAQI